MNKLKTKAPSRGFFLDFLLEKSKLRIEEMFFKILFILNIQKGERNDRQYI